MILKIPPETTIVGSDPRIGWEYELVCNCGGQLDSYDCIACGVRHPNLADLPLSGRKRQRQYYRGKLAPLYRGGPKMEFR